MQIKLIQPHNCGAWDTFIESHPCGTFYHHRGWKDVIEKSFRHQTFYLLANEDNRVQGILPLVHLKSFLFGSIFCSMPFLNFGGICAENARAEYALIRAARRIMREHKGDFLELRHSSKSTLDLPVRTHKVSMTLALTDDPTHLWNRFKSKHRTNIRRAEKHGLVVKAGRRELLPDFYKIISAGWRDLGTPLYSFKFFENIVDVFGDAIEIFVVYHQTQPIATAFNGRFKDTIEGMWTYALREHIRLQTNNYLYWKMIEKACVDGFKLYHLGRSTDNSGATVFKKKWNATPTQLYWEYLLNRNAKLPNLSVDNPKYRLARKTWQKLPIPIARIIGPLLARSIP